MLPYRCVPIGCLLLILVQPVPAATVLRVNRDATGTPTVNPTDWNDAYRDLQSAIDAALPDAGYEIWVRGYPEQPPPPKYYPTDPTPPEEATDRDATFQLKSGVVIYGGFTGQQEDRVPDQYRTILSGAIHFLQDDDNSLHVVTVSSGTSADTILDGVTVSDGYNDDRGAGILVKAGGQLTLRNCRILDNHAYDGGGMFAAANQVQGQAIVTMDDCLLVANFAKYHGAAIFNEGQLKIHRSDLRQNALDSGSEAGLGGGAIYNGHVDLTATTTIDDSALVLNASNYCGGAIANEFSGTMSLTNCTIASNVTYTQQYGAGICNAGGAVTVLNSILWDNNPVGLSAGELDDQVSGAATVTWSDISDGAPGETVPFGGETNHNIDLNPNLVGEGGSDFRLGDCSPCKEKGLTSAASLIDLDRLPRVVDPEVDMGAYERQHLGGACCLGGTCMDVNDPGCCKTFVCNIAEYFTAPPYAFCYGDMDGNGLVNAADRGFISAAIGHTDNVSVCKYDLDGNGIINPGDRGYVAANVGLCTDLPDFQNGSNHNHGVCPDPRFPNFKGEGSDCAGTTCSCS